MNRSLRYRGLASLSFILRGERTVKGGAAGVATSGVSAACFWVLGAS